MKIYWPSFVEAGEATLTRATRIHERMAAEVKMLEDNLHGTSKATGPSVLPKQGTEKDGLHKKTLAENALLTTENEDLRKRLVEAGLSVPPRPAFAQEAEAEEGAENSHTAAALLQQCEVYIKKEEEDD